jgi:hypothetical protein
MAKGPAPWAAAVVSLRTWHLLTFRLTADAFQPLYPLLSFWATIHDAARLSRPLSRRAVRKTTPLFLPAVHHVVQGCPLNSFYDMFSSQFMLHTNSLLHATVLSSWVYGHLKMLDPYRINVLTSLFWHCIYLFGARGSVVFKALCYKSESRGFETRWGEWTFSIYLIPPAALGPGVYSTSNRNEYQKLRNNVSGE